ncbi:DUF4327 family protein [Crocosphaera sp. UHCC 0190]|uniref:DUF4327 family protein n=1 Tax=Crocosphaera sp. UHCC 0190 TaxID=3110246 RepID=UPI003A521028
MTRYSIEDIQEEARQLVQQGKVDRKQRIYTLCQYLPSGEWSCIEMELERHDFLLRDCIGDLIPSQEWATD